MVPASLRAPRGHLRQQSFDDRRDRHKSGSALILNNLSEPKLCNLLRFSYVLRTKDLGCESSLQKQKTPAGALALRDRWIELPRLQNTLEVTFCQEQRR